MSQREPWADFFEISDEQLESWRHQAGAEELLHFALRSGELDQSAYLQWASRRYELPYVAPDFFQSGPSRELWERFRGDGPWCPSVQPLDFWDGVLIVGCAQPGPLPPQAVEVRLVLAPASFLQTNWDAIHGSAAAPDTSTSPGGVVDLGVEEPLAPRGFAAEANAVDEPTASFAPVEIDGPNLDKAERPIPEAPAPRSLTAAQAPDLAAPAHRNGAVLEAPEGMGFSLAPPPFPVEEDNAQDEIEMPEGFAISLGEPESSTDEGAPDGLRLAMAPTAPPAPAPAAAPAPAPAPATAPATAPAPAEELGGERAPRPFPKRDAGVNKDDSSPLELTHTQTQTAGKPTVMKGASANPAEAPRFESCQTYEQVAEAAFRMVQPPYQRSMMLVFQGGLLKPWRWTTEFHPRKEKPHPIDLERPSVFRIVYNSMLPYHGRVVPNDVNSRFFDQLDGGRIPSHLTIVPIMVDKQMAAMLLSATDAEISLRGSLALMERVGDQMGDALKRVRAGKDPAA